MSGVVKNFDVRVVDGLDMRYKIVKHINQSFDALDDMYKSFKGAVDEEDKMEFNSICNIMWCDMNAELALFEGLGLLRKGVLDKLHTKMSSYELD